MSLLISISICFQFLSCAHADSGKLNFPLSVRIPVRNVIGNGERVHRNNLNRTSEQVREAVVAGLFTEVEASLGNRGKARTHEFEAILRPVFHALPKNAHGNLEQSAVRYALHRIFLQRHGWFVNGLSGLAAQSSQCPLDILKNQVPAYLHDMFKQRLAKKGLGLFELSVLAASIEHLVHTESTTKLKIAFKAHKKSPSSQLNETEAQIILETYIMWSLKHDQMKEDTPTFLKKMLEGMNRTYPNWPVTQKWIHDARRNISGDAETIGFDTVVSIVEFLNDQFGNHQNAECLDMKAALLKGEYRQTGRVRLHDFYKRPHFVESASYLRYLGALDESDPEDPKVVVTNYLGVNANCLVSSNFYSVCCMDECESLLMHIENDIKAPDAPPARIAELVAGLPSASVSAPRELSQTLHGRLDDIAALHGGSIRLHSRLFSQWMHHAYPRECPYPHVSGTVGFLDGPGFRRATGNASSLKEEEMRKIVEKGKSRSKPLWPISARMSAPEHANEMEYTELIPWSQDDELLVKNSLELPPTAAFSCLDMRGIVTLFAVASVAAGLMRTAASAKCAVIDSPTKFDM